jgi:hypothetical protein
MIIVMSGTFSRNVIDNFRSINETSRAVRVTIVSDATTWSVTYGHHSDDSIGVIHYHNIFIKQATDVTFISRRGIRCCVLNCLILLA